MKKLLLFLLVLFCSIDISAQNPDIIGTWYLEAYTFDLGDPIFITLDDYPQNPTLTINQDLSYNGIGACNEFSGNIVFIDDFEYNSIDFSADNEDCGNPDYNSSENTYFGHFNQEITSSPIVYIYGGGTQLYWEIAPGFGLQFQDTPFLSTQDNVTTNVTLFPNPTLNNLSINTNGFSISEISIYTSKGRLIASEIYNGQTIDVSSLNSDIYFLELISEGKKTVKKFIKE